MAEIQNSESSDSSSGHVSDLPSSLIYEILVKLPIKSVLQCRCVCKNWNDLISKKHFTTLYSKNPPFTVLAKFKDCTVQDGSVNQSSCFIEIGLNGDVTCTPFNPRAIDFQRNGGILENVSSCNGLLCFVQRQFHENDNYYNFNYDAVYVMNPLFGEVMMLPRVNQSEDIEYAFCGFGFSIQSDHYKAVRFVSMSVGDIHGEILTIGVDHEWRSFEDSSIPYYLYPRPITLNGFLYFVADGCIFAFDIEEERGRIITLPSKFDEMYEDKWDYIVLGVFNGNLCLSDNTSEHWVDIWIMKLNGVVESWSREIILKSWISFDLCSDQLILVTTSGNGDLLMSCQNFFFDNSKMLMSYDLRTNEYRTLKYSDGEGELSYFYGHVPSFLPLNSVL